MESTRSATHHQRADAQLYALMQALNLYDGFGCAIYDNELRVTRFGATPHKETITCSPRSKDAGALWFWTSDRHPLGEADKIQDAALALAAHMPPTP